MAVSEGFSDHIYLYVVAFPPAWLSVIVTVAVWLVWYVVFPLGFNVTIGASLSNLNTFETSVVQLPKISQAVAFK